VLLLSNDSKGYHNSRLIVLGRFPSLLAVRAKEASDGFHTIGDVMTVELRTSHELLCKRVGAYNSYLYSLLKDIATPPTTTERLLPFVLNSLPKFTAAKLPLFMIETKPWLQVSASP